MSGTLSFAAGQTAKTVVIPIIDNGPKPPRNFVLTLSNPTGGASIADGTGTIVIGASPSARVPEPGILAPPDVVVGEADGYVDLPVRLSAPGQSPLSVSYSTSSGAASSGTACSTSSPSSSDFVTRTGTLNFAPGETTKVVRVPLLDCTDVEGLVSFKFTLSGQSGNATLLRAATLVSIVDDSTSGSNPRLFARDAVVDQKDGNVLVPILLGGPAGQVTDSVVTVHYETADGTARRERRLRPGQRNGQLCARPDREDDRRADLRHRPEADEALHPEPRATRARTRRSPTTPRPSRSGRARRFRWRSPPSPPART